MRSGSGQVNERERELPMLAGIAAVFRWAEELLNILNGPILMFGAGVALVDLLTDGALTVAVPTLLFAWAISQALGIDTQLLGCFARARTTGNAWGRVGWLALGLVLGYAAWQAGYVFGVQQSQHITEAAALAQLGMDPQVWLGWRAFLGVGLVALSGWTRYRRPVQDAAADAESERARLQREAELEPLRQQVRARKAAGVVSLGRVVIDAARGKPQPPTGPGSPAAAPVATEGSTYPPSDGRKITALPAPKPRRQAARMQQKKRGVRTPARLTATVEGKVRAHWRHGMTVGQLQRAAGISQGAAGKWHAVMVRESSETEQERAQIAQ